MKTRDEHFKDAKEDRYMSQLNGEHINELVNSIKEFYFNYGWNAGRENLKDESKAILSVRATE